MPAASVTSRNLVQVNVALWERDADVLRIELLFDGFRYAKKHAPVVWRLYPWPDHEIHAVVGKLRDGNRWGRVL